MIGYLTETLKWMIARTRTLNNFLTTATFFLKKVKQDLINKYLKLTSENY